MAKEVVAMLLAGGQGSQLYALTQRLAKSAVPFGGKYRIIDFPLSNCVNSGIDTVGVLTQFQPYVLNEYIGNGQPWDLDRLYGGVHVLSPYQKADGSDWYKGTANAIYQNLQFIQRYDPKYVLVVTGDQICKQDYSDLIYFHKKCQADVSVAFMEVDPSESFRYGMGKLDENSCLISFEEKPQQTDAILASIGVYVFNWDVLQKVLKADEADAESSNDFGKDIIPALIGSDAKVYGYRFEGYWKDVGTIDSLWQANMEVLDPEESGINLFDDWKIYSRNSGLPGHRITGDAVVENSMVTDGCKIRGTIEHSILSAGVLVEEGAVIENSVIMAHSVVSRGAHIINSIIAEKVTIGEDAVIGGVCEDGVKVTTIGNGAVIKAGTHVEPGAMVYGTAIEMEVEQ